MEFVALDIECTGFREEDKIIEFAYVHFNTAGEILAQDSFLVDPEQSIPSVIVNLTHISDDDVRGQPTIEHFLPEIQRVLDLGLPIVGHNINFDLTFLAKVGIKCDNVQIDTFWLSQLFIPDQESYALEILADSLGLTQESAHRAGDDTMANVELFWEILQRMAKYDDETKAYFKLVFTKLDYPLVDLLEVAAMKEPSNALRRRMVMTEMEYQEVEQQGVQIEEAQEQTITTIFKQEEDVVVEVTKIASRSIITNLSQRVGERILVVARGVSDLVDLQRSLGSGVQVIDLPSKYFSLENFVAMFVRDDWDIKEMFFALKIWLMLPQMGDGHRDYFDLRSDDFVVWKDVMAQNEGSIWQSKLALATKAQLVVVSHDFLPQLSLLLNDEDQDLSILDHKPFTKIVFLGADYLYQSLDHIFAVHMNKNLLQDQVRIATLDRAILSHLTTTWNALEQLLLANLAHTNELVLEGQLLNNITKLKQEFIAILALVIDESLQVVLQDLITILSGSNEQRIAVVRAYKDVIYLNSYLIDIGAELQRRVLNLGQQKIFLVENSLINGSSWLWSQQNLPNGTKIKTLKLSKKVLRTIAVPEHFSPANDTGFFADNINFLKQINTPTVGQNVQKKIILIVNSNAVIANLFDKLMKNKAKNTVILGQNASGSAAKIAYKMTRLQNKSLILICSRSYVRNFLHKTMEFDVVIWQKLPFSYFNDVRSKLRNKLLKNAFMEDVLPSCALNFKATISMMVKLSHLETKFWLLDRKIFDTPYGADLRRMLSDEVNFQNVNDK